MSEPTSSTPQETTQPADTATTYHWVMTVQFDNGRQVATYDGSIGVVPGVHTRMATYTHLREHMQRNVGTNKLTVLFFDLQPNHL